jgi:transmembrane sensor
LSPGTKLTHLENTAHAFSLLLEAGRVDVEVTPGGPRQWSFECGLATVEVVGTEFSIARTPERVRIEVTEGIVLVRGERVPDRVRRLTAGDVLEISVPIAAHEQPAAPAAAVPPADPSEEDQGASSAPAPSAKPTRPAWRELARRGEYADAYRSLGDRGIAQEAARSSVDDLLALADVARLSGHAVEAVAPLRRVIDEHPGDGRAAVAAFTLARIQLDSLGQPAAAAQSFSQALSLGLPAPLVEDARARIVEAHARAGNRDAARNAADQYDKLYPAGRHASAVRRWVND